MFLDVSKWNTLWVVYCWFTSTEWQHVQLSELLSEFQCFLTSKLLQHNLCWLAARIPLVLEVGHVAEAPPKGLNQGGCPFSEW